MSSTTFQRLIHLAPDHICKQQKPVIWEWGDHIYFMSWQRQWSFCLGINTYFESGLAFLDTGSCYKERMMKKCSYTCRICSLNHICLTQCYTKLKWPSEDIIISLAGRVYPIRVLYIITRCNVSFELAKNIIFLKLESKEYSYCKNREIFLLNLIRCLEIF